MKDMDEQVGIIGIGEPAYERQLTDSMEEMVHEAARAALADAGLDRTDLDNVVVCASDLEDGRAISSMITACPAGGYRKDFIKTTDTGIHALGLAEMRMATGVFDTTLVLSWAKQSETNENQIRHLEADPAFRRGTGLGHRTGHALTAATYADEVSDSAAAADAVVERNTRNAVKDDKSVRMARTDSDDVSDSDLVSWPLREAHIPEPCDGACAVVLASENACTASDTEPVWLDGLGWETDGYDLSTQSAGDLAALTGAAQRAYDDAGVTNPSSDLDAVEIHEQSAFHELLALESLGLAEDGEAPSAVLDGAFGPDGEVEINSSGGPFGANPLIATGLARVAAATRQIRNGNADRAAATATAGFTDQVHGVAVLGGDDT